MNDPTPSKRRVIGLLGATGVGIGAIVGGGILVLAGPAFEYAGPGAIVAFAINGLIAILTALSFAEMSTAFPESGGAYTFAKKVLSVRAAFAVGWILWFAYIVAAVLYALGFAEYGVAVVREGWLAFFGSAPAWLSGRGAANALALGATALYTLSLIRKAAGGGQWATVGKLVVFALLIAAGFWVLAGRPSGTVAAGFSPFLPKGGGGLLQAMGFTFIALQGFDLIAAIAGEVRQPERTIPRAMLLSLGAALVVYLPLLFVVAAVGTPHGQSIVAIARANPDTTMAVAVKNFLGPLGYWLVVVAAILSTLSALQANLLAASRVALTMATDRTLPRVLSQSHPARRTPVMAIYASALAVVAILLMVPNLAAAGAAASLIFLISFALAHWTSILARRRAGDVKPPFQTPWFPAVPVVGGIACAAMAVFQGFAVPAAGAISAVWLGLGVILYFALFANRAEAVDAFAQAGDPLLVRLRGRSPLVLVPVANPKSAPAMVAVAGALAPPAVGRVLLLSVMQRPDEVREGEPPASLVAAQDVLKEALTASLASGHSPEALMTIAPLPWNEIGRVARAHGCESLLLGLSNIDSMTNGGGHLEELINDVECDVAVLRAPPGWQLESAHRILVPIGGRSAQDELRARLLGSLCRGADRHVTFLRVMPPHAPLDACEDARHQLLRLAEDETRGKPEAALATSDDPVEAIAERAADYDLVVLGLQRVGGRKAFGDVALGIARHAPCATIMLSRGR
jgi:basic amino acid/polyamine antiporter, APA family